MRTYFYIFLCVAFFISLPLMAVDVSISILHQNSDVSWSITNDVGHEVYSSDPFGDIQVCQMILDDETSYFFNVDVRKTNEQDSSLLLLSVNNSGVLLVLNENETGTSTYSFFTGIKDPYLKIVGGEDVDISEVPWQVYFRFGDYQCGGTIISKRWILTAAHCTFDGRNRPVSVDDMYVIVGKTNPFSSTDGHVYYIKDYIVHESYNSSTIINDIALLELTEDIDVSNAQAIGLISEYDVSNGASDPGVMALISGWGLTGVSPDTYVDDLQKVELPIVSNTTASQVWDGVTAGMLMAGYRDAEMDACSGDSGGPLVVDVDGIKKLAGVVSWGSQDCDTYGAYTRVSSYLDWINVNTDYSVLNKPEVPIGSSTVCRGHESDFYSTQAPESTDYEWVLSPSDAGVIVPQEENDEVVVLWNEDYVGDIILAVRALIDDEWSEWSSLGIVQKENISLLNEINDYEVCPGDLVEFSFETEGDIIKYNWYKDGLYYSNTNESKLNLGFVDTTYSGMFSCEIIGLCDTVVLTPFELMVHPTTTVVNQNDDFFVTSGQDATFSISCIGYNMQIQWFKNGVLIDGAQEEDFIISSLDANDIGKYSAVVDGFCGTDTVADIYLYVAQDSTRLDNEGVEARVWPSVVDKSLHVALSKDDKYNVDIYNSSGALVLQRKYVANETIINMRLWAAGVYIVRISNHYHTEEIRVIKL